jgi:hypothetical protein
MWPLSQTVALLQSRRIPLLVLTTRVMNVIVTVSRAKEIAYMKTFTIDHDNNITVFASKKEAAAASSTPFDPFTDQAEFAELAAAWPANRLVEIWNGIPGVIAVTKFTNRKIATERIWKAIQNLGADAPTRATEASESVAEVPFREPAPTNVEAQTNPEVMPDALAGHAATEQSRFAADGQPAQPEPVAHVGTQGPEVAPVAIDPAPKTTAKKKVAKAPVKADPPKTEKTTREGSKTARVVTMLQRTNGATLAEIMQTMAWQKHTVRGFMAGAMKKAGYAIESFKPEGGERTYESASSAPTCPFSPARLRPRRAFFVHSEIQLEYFRLKSDQWSCKEKHSNDTQPEADQELQRIRHPVAVRYRTRTGDSDGRR